MTPNPETKVKEREEQFKREICTCDRGYLEENYHHLNCPVIRFKDLIQYDQIK